MTKNNNLDTCIISTASDNVKTAGDIITEMTQHKLLAERVQSALANYYSRAARPEKASKIAGCGSYLELRRYNNAGQTTTLHKGSWCMHPMCPMCAWRKHLKQGAVLSQAIQGMDDLYLVTLTVDNTSTLLRNQVRDIISASTKMLRQVLQVNTYAANIEVTERGHGYHPHIHAIVQQPYWSARDIKYSMADWRRKWGQIAGGKHGYNLLDIRRIDDGIGAVAEVTKYISKMSVDTDIARAVDVLAPALHGIRQLRTAGEIKRRIAVAKIDLQVADIIERLRLLGYDYHLLISRWIGGAYDTYDYTARTWREGDDIADERRLERDTLCRKLDKLIMSRQG